MFKSLYIPGLGWSVDVQTHYPDSGPRWGHDRGRCREHVWWMPLGRWTLTLNGRGLPYWKLVGFEHKPSVDWMLDEYDSSFNRFAAASLRYHLDYSVVDNSENVERRALYEDLIKRLTEPRPQFTREELDTLKAIDAASEESGVPLFIPIEPGNPDAGYRIRPSTEQEDAIGEAQQAREDAWYERNDQARHDFVGIMRHLWS
jgi:hypothetical protein